MKELPAAITLIILTVTVTILFQKAVQVRSGECLVWALILTFLAAGLLVNRFGS